MAAAAAPALEAEASGAGEVAEALRVKSSKQKLESLMGGFDKFESVMKQGTRVRRALGTQAWRRRSNRNGCRRHGSQQAPLCRDSWPLTATT